MLKFKNKQSNPTRLVQLQGSPEERGGRIWGQGGHVGGGVGGEQEMGLGPSSYARSQPHALKGTEQPLAACFCCALCHLWRWQRTRQTHWGSCHITRVRRNVFPCPTVCGKRPELVLDAAQVCQPASFQCKLGLHYQLFPYLRLHYYSQIYCRTLTELWHSFYAIHYCFFSPYLQNILNL